MSTAAGRHTHFCYQCDRPVTLTPSSSSSSDPICPLCLGGFLEELDQSSQFPNPNPNPNPNFPILDPFFSFSDPFFGVPGPGPGSSLLFASTPVDLENPLNFSPHRFPPPLLRDTSIFDPFLFLQNHLQNLRADGASIQIVIENHPSEPGFRLPANIGDYFIGPGLEQLIQQLAENDPNRYGTPPASRKAVEGLPTVRVTEEMVGEETAQCAVCMEGFEVGNDVKQMPCKHLYHDECILPWLEMHNSCPVCRFELPTDDEYERSRGGGGERAEGSESEGRNGSGTSTESGSRRPGLVERRFRISLPWPLNMFGGFGDGGNEGGGGTGSSSGGQSGNQGGGFQPRQEDLD